MRVNDIMTQDVEQITSDTSVQDAARRMKARDIGFLAISDEGSAVGVITDRDLVVRCLGAGNDPATCTVDQIMTKAPRHLSAEDSVEDAAMLMEKHQIKRLLVTDESNHIIGVLTLGDIANATHDAELCGQVTECISKPTR